MRTALALVILGCVGCKSDPPDQPKPAQVPDKPVGPEEVVLTIKAPPGQLVETPQGLWMTAGLGTKDSPVVLKDGPASIAELGFARSWVDHPPCATEVTVRSQELVGGDQWLDRVEVRCESKWYGEIFFDLTTVVERQIEALRGAEDPRVRLGLEKQKD
jgi:hypothetical protein